MSPISRRAFISTTTAALTGLSGRAWPDGTAQQEQMNDKTTDAFLCTPITRAHLRVYDHAFALREGLDGWRRELDDERRIGANLLWMSHVRPALADTDSDTLRYVLDACAERNMGAIIETGHTPNWYGHCDLKRELQEMRDVCALLATRYGDHPAFHAWYIHHEIYVAYDAFGAYIDDLYPAAVEACKNALPGKPVTLSPFFILDQDQVFGDFRYAEPEEYREYWTHLIRRSGFDIIMLQDSGEHFSYVTMEQRRPFFEAMQGACRDSGATLWGNVETAEKVIDSIEQYVEQYGRIHHSKAKGIPWRNVPLERLEQKLRLAAEYADNIVSWGYYQFGRPHLNEEAKSWYDAYRGYYEKISAAT